MRNGRETLDNKKQATTIDEKNVAVPIIWRLQLLTRISMNVHTRGPYNIALTICWFSSLRRLFLRRFLSFSGLVLSGIFFSRLFSLSRLLSRRGRLRGRSSGFGFRLCRRRGILCLCLRSGGRGRFLSCFFCLGFRSRGFCLRFRSGSGSIRLRLCRLVGRGGSGNSL